MDRLHVAMTVLDDDIRTIYKYLLKLLILAVAL